MASVGSVLVFALAYLAPVETVRADSAVALLGSQALVDHGTLRLDPYLGHADLAYALEDDYRVRRYQGAYYPNSLGVPIVSAPAVWLANRLGFDMLDQGVEFATQNLLSALACALLYLLLCRICGGYLGGTESVGIAAVSTFGTSAISTGATGLWNSNYSLLFVSLVVLHLVRRDRGTIARLNLPYLAALLAAGFLCRPSTAFLGVACLIYLLREGDRRIAAGAAVGLAATVVIVAIPSLGFWPWMAGHYSPDRLQLINPLGLGLYGLLLSPSRGLFVFSPFLVIVAVGAVGYWRGLRTDRLFQLCVVWCLLHVVIVSVSSGKWWGGHSFGPRLLIDLVPATVVLTCLVCQRLRQCGSASFRRAAVAGYLTLAAAAVILHTGQGLFNPATERWNRFPDIDQDPALALDWRFPQFLASYRGLETRWTEYERRAIEDHRRRLAPYALGAPVAFDSSDIVFLHWQDTEAEWRWTRGDHSTVLFRLGHVEAQQLHLLEILAGALGTQREHLPAGSLPAVTGCLQDEDPIVL